MGSKGKIKCTNARYLLLAVVMICCVRMESGLAQRDTLGFWDTPGAFHKGRFWGAAGTGSVALGGTLFALSTFWYNDYPQTSFHFFDDRREWLQMDKAGHMFTAYFLSDWSYYGARWTGMSRSSSIWAGMFSAFGIQGSLEVLDGFSSGWGFSWFDIGANLAGSALWGVQQASWDEQRIRMKVSGTYRRYPNEIVTGIPGGSNTLAMRAKDLYGSGILQTFLKDYNAQTIWISVNIGSFLGESQRFPGWLNLAVGYGAENMFGGIENKWEAQGNKYEVSGELYPRYRQWYLSPDVDLSRIRVKSRPFRMVLGMLNVFKLPAPALEIRGRGGVRWRWLHY